MKQPPGCSAHSCICSMPLVRYNAYSKSLVTSTVSISLDRLGEVDLAIQEKNLAEADSFKSHEKAPFDDHVRRRVIKWRIKFTVCTMRDIGG
ncbi:hypothetical protein MPTK1_4g16210 [Marchantia polymorpha subsp. ruderalis]|uniref:Uncharacterized protein n=2 Tax=Marchantia polymorpha TaxID=3197 RepID=A0AAF6BAF8_MARPO|nr:hypothetical protein MARPO_0054s0086 [Marchantia polymorpha]BBN08992.1 hypothetical protein Mp_4g16210 [Marchantia polymorpha subsp. ruderalis]|eukprot:PTQ37979.1 hypothetical protein MARPO_0054s0086 [Marchantia polymorpha]